MRAFDPGDHGADRRNVEAREGIYDQALTHALRHDRSSRGAAAAHVLGYKMQVTDPKCGNQPRARRLNRAQKFSVGVFYLMIVVALVAAFAVPASNATGRLAHSLIAICALAVAVVFIGFPLMFLMAWRESQAAKRR